MSEETGVIRFNGTSVGDSGNVDSSKRYILVKPKYNGTFSIDIAFDSASGSTKSRIYYRDFETDEIDLTSCVKSGTPQLDGDFTSSNVGTRTLDMKAGHTYVLYTYQKASKISAMSFAYTNQTDEPAETEEPIETEKPAADTIEIVKEEARGNTIDYTVKINGVSDGTLIAAVYNDDKSLYSVDTENLNDGNVKLSVDIPDGAEAADVKLMLWDGLETMVPLAMLKHTYKAAGATPVIPYEPVEEKASSVHLDRVVYPLVAGNSSKTDFSSWEDQGSSFTLSAAVDSGSASDVTWEIEDSDIAYIRDNKTSGESVSIRGKRTGVTKAIATAPNGDKAECLITVIDNVTRETVQSLDFNTNALTLAPNAYQIH